MGVGWCADGAMVCESVGAPPACQSASCRVVLAMMMVLQMAICHISQAGALHGRGSWADSKVWGPAFVHCWDLVGMRGKACAAGVFLYIAAGVSVRSPAVP